jgi:hypothetical protein
LTPVKLEIICILKSLSLIPCQLLLSTKSFLCSLLAQTSNTTKFCLRNGCFVLRWCMFILFSKINLETLVWCPYSSKFQENLESNDEKHENLHHNQSQTSVNYTRTRSKYYHNPQIKFKSKHKAFADIFSEIKNKNTLGEKCL